MMVSNIQMIWWFISRLKWSLSWGRNIIVEILLLKVKSCCQNRQCHSMSILRKSYSRRPQIGLCWLVHGLGTPESDECAFAYVGVGSTIVEVKFDLPSRTVHWAHSVTASNCIVSHLDDPVVCNEILTLKRFTWIRNKCYFWTTFAGFITICCIITIRLLKIECELPWVGVRLQRKLSHRILCLLKFSLMVKRFFL